MDDLLQHFKLSQNELASNDLVTEEVFFTVTLFSDVKAKKKREVQTSLAALERAHFAITAPCKEELPLIKLAKFGNTRTCGGSLRSDNNLQAITGIEADYDDEEVSLPDAARLLQRAGIVSLILPTAFHTEAAPRWRVICPLPTESAVNERHDHVVKLNAALGGILAKESFTPSQAFYFGRVSHEAL